MIYVLIGAVIGGLLLAPVAQRVVPPSRGSIGGGAIETYVGTALAVAFMLAVLGGAIYGVIAASV